MTRNGIVDRRAWTLCLVDRLRGAEPALRRSPLGLLDGAAWEAARPTVCRTLGKSQNAAEEIGRLAERLDLAFRAVADNLPRNAGVRIDQNGAAADLVLTGLDRLDEPASLVALRTTVAARLPRVDLPELLLEIDARTGFAGAFTHASEAEARVRDLTTTLCAVLLAEPTLRGDACAGWPTTGSRRPRSFTLGRMFASPSSTQGRSRMRECRTYGSARGRSAMDVPTAISEPVQAARGWMLTAKPRCSRRATSCRVCRSLACWSKLSRPRS